MIDTYHVILTGVTTCLGLGLVGCSFNLTRLQNEVNEKESKLEDAERTNKGLAYHLNRLTDDNITLKGQFDRLDRAMDRVLKRENSLLEKNRGLTESNLKLTTERDYYKSLQEQRERLTLRDQTVFCSPDGSEVMAYHVTLRGTDMMRSDEELEESVRHELAESISSLFAIQMVDSVDGSGFRKDVKIKFILKQLDYEIKS